jgi:hypothetical protein
MSPATGILALWIGWAVSWTLAAVWSNRTEKRPGIGAQIRYRAPMIIGAVLMFSPNDRHQGALRLGNTSWIGAWLCARLPQN